MSLEVYGIPNCNSCKKACQWLDAQGLKYLFINTKENPPSHQMIQNWVKSLGSQSMRNTSGLSYRAIGDEKKTWDDDQWVNAFAQDAMLLKRPLFIKDGIAVMVGFKEKDIAALLA